MPPREHDRVDPSQHGHVHADVFLDAIAEDVDGKFRAAIALLALLEQRAHVVRLAAHTQQPGLLVAELIQRGHVVAPFREVEEDGRVEIAGSGSMTRPSRGVSPMEVSTDRPASTAAIEQPFPGAR